MLSSSVVEHLPGVRKPRIQSPSFVKGKQSVDWDSHLFHPALYLLSSADYRKPQDRAL